MVVSMAAYREAMAGFAEMPTMDIWYPRLSEEVPLRNEFADFSSSSRPNPNRDLSWCGCGAAVVQATRGCL